MIELIVSACATLVSSIVMHLHKRHHVDKPVPRWLAKLVFYEVNYAYWAEELHFEVDRRMERTAKRWLEQLRVSTDQLGGVCLNIPTHSHGKSLLATAFEPAETDAVSRYNRDSATNTRQPHQRFLK